MKKIILTLTTAIVLSVFPTCVVAKVGLEKVSVQQDDRNAIKIVTGHPDLKVKVKRCAASGKIVIIDLTFTNVGTSDIEAWIRLNSYAGDSEAIDDEGTVYKSGDALTIKLPNNPQYQKGPGGKITMLPDIPVKVSVKLNGVSESAEAIARLLVGVQCEAWGLADHCVQIRNIPISRE